jgi:hypothetical protein
LSSSEVRRCDQPGKRGALRFFSHLSLGRRKSVRRQQHHLRRLVQLGDAALVLSIAIGCNSPEKTRAASSPNGPADVQATSATELIAPANPGSVHQIAGEVVAPVLRTPWQPRFPVDQPKHLVTGTMFVIEAVVNEQGQVCRTTVVRRPLVEPPWPELEASILQQLNALQYQPATLHGKPVAVSLTLVVHVNLR